MSTILKGMKIWKGNVHVEDTYVDFSGCFSAETEEKIYLRISCDSVYTAYVNGKIAGFAACADYPEHRNFDKIDITKLCRKENELKITVWHYGINSQTYIAADAFLLFDVIQGDKALLKSGTSVLSRKNTKYKNGYCKKITGQLGLSFLYNANKKDGGYTASEDCGEGIAVLRKRKLCVLKSRKKAAIETFRGGCLIDMGSETVGALELEFESRIVQKLTISYAEHLTRGTVQRKIGGRDFSVEYVAKKGKNAYLNTFRRIAGRYLYVEYEDPIDIAYIGIRCVEYPLKTVKKQFDDKLLQKIYDVSVYTLKCCMHEHYEDCPWREQALYTMDSRNQMLCGYYAFKGSLYQRENLLLIAKGLRKDGLLSICFPAGNDVPIPFFSLVYVMQVWEYIEHTRDRSILKDTGNILETIMQAFTSRVEENGLIADFDYPYWNFYEWTDGSDNGWQIFRKKSDAGVKQYDLLLNCFYVIACKYYEKITGIQTDTSKTRDRVKEVFYNEEKRAYKLSAEIEKYSQLGNAAAILAGIGGEQDAESMVADETFVKVSLSMNSFYYDALLEFGDKYKKFILNDIRSKYGAMLAQGATTFWETEKGWRDFDNAGSLCHGWSALPVYYLSKLKH